jgi:hypothetical protein
MIHLDSRERRKEKTRHLAGESAGAGNAYAALPRF